MRPVTGDGDGRPSRDPEERRRYSPSENNPENKANGVMVGLYRARSGSTRSRAKLATSFAPRLRVLKRPVFGVPLRIRPMRRGLPPARATARFICWRKLVGQLTRASPRAHERPKRGSKRVSSWRVMGKIFDEHQPKTRCLQTAAEKISIFQSVTKIVAPGRSVWRHVAPIKQCADKHLETRCTILHYDSGA